MTVIELSERVAALTAERDRLRAERDRYREHSVTLNTVGFKLAEALGDVPPGADQVEGNPIEQAERLIAALDCYRRALEKIWYQAEGAPSLQALAATGLRLEVWDGSVPPGGYVCAVCRVPVESEPCPNHGKAAAQ